MNRYEIHHIVWHELSQRMEVAYVVGESERIFTTKFVASELARDAGLVLEPSAPGTTQWVRELDSQRSSPVTHEAAAKD